eukprot:5352500-Amphidinium_carterae.1
MPMWTEAVALALMDRGRERDARPVRGRYQLADSSQGQPTTRGYASQGQKRPPQRPRQEESAPERSKRVCCSDYTGKPSQ